MGIMTGTIIGIMSNNWLLTCLREDACLDHRKHSEDDVDAHDALRETAQNIACKTCVCV